MLSIARSKAQKRAKGAREDAAAAAVAAGSLPPLEAFTFKSFMNSIEPDDAGHSISADLDRIAEICARSRYSLSNQYEVHKTPHGSGESFLAAVSAPNLQQPPQGPTLQAVSSDDERQMARHGRRRRPGMRRRSVAVGTLETIMSSSRSSEEDKSKKHKSAAEIAEDVRNRAAARKGSGSSSPVSSTEGDATASGENAPTAKPEDTSGEAGQETQQVQPRRKSVSLAAVVIENTRQHGITTATITTTGTTASRGRSASSPKASAPGLISEPARPQTSTNYLEIRPVADQSAASGDAATSAKLKTKGESHNNTATAQQQGILSNLTGWIWWRPATPGASGPKTSHAEGSLRELLKSSEEDKGDVKGKGVERPM